MASGLTIRPQPGPQELFLRSPADIVVYGGSAGGGKTWSLLVEPLRHIANPAFSGVIFRRSFPQIKSPGGLLDASYQIYPYVGGICRPSSLRWNFPSGAYLVFRHMKNDHTVLDWQGTELAFAAFDELTHFSDRMFWGIVSRLRSTSGVRPYLRATCNPAPADDPVGGWVRKLIDWWIDDDGYAIADRSGVVRWLRRQGDELHWSIQPCTESLSFTFIRSSLADNQVLLRTDPKYEANLRSLPLVERARLLDGNWNIKPVAGVIFQAGWLPVVGAAPDGLRVCRSWDFASTAASAGGDPDYTANVKLGLSPEGKVYVLDAWRGRMAPGSALQTLRSMAELDGPGCEVVVQRDPGAAGEYLLQQQREVLRGFPLRGITTTLSKLERSRPVSTAAEFGDLALLAGDWNGPFINELISFPTKGIHDDWVDALSLGYSHLTGKGKTQFGTARYR